MTAPTTGEPSSRINFALGQWLITTARMGLVMVAPALKILPDWITLLLLFPSRFGAPQTPPAQFFPYPVDDVASRNALPARRSRIPVVSEQHFLEEFRIVRAAHDGDEPEF
jgi:hypothetical protein